LHLRSTFPSAVWAAPRQAGEQNFCAAKAGETLTILPQPGAWQVIDTFVSLAIRLHSGEQYFFRSDRRAWKTCMH
jgi:hypothetical protein